jgi:hypothetical protein
MSKDFLSILQSELEAYIMAEAGIDYRINAENEAHTFTVRKENIRNEIEKELLKRFDFKETALELTTSREVTVGKNANGKGGVKKDLVPELINIRDAATDEILSQIRLGFDEKGDDFEIKVNKTFVNLNGRWVIYSDLETKQQRARFDRDLEATMYGQISNSYGPARRKYKNRINTLLRADGREKNQIRGAFLVIGHSAEKRSSIIERRTSSNYKGIKQRLQGAGISDQNLEELFKDDILLIRKLDDNNDSMWYVELQSAWFNNPNIQKILGTEYTEAQLRDKYEAILRKGMLSLAENGKFANWEGSDSRNQIEKKKIVKSFIDKAKKDKKIKVSSIDTKLKLSSGTPVKRKIKRKAPSKRKKKTTLTVKNKTKIPVASQTKSTLNLNALKAEINAKLSMTVIKNMGTPALENRTGRFARSVEVTDVIQTPKGFPSIGYTYQKGPYQTFEPGFAQGSIQRDPRVVISKSIREIAKELIVGRFYTRRV